MATPPDICDDDYCPEPIMPRKALLIWAGMILGGASFWLGLGWLLWRWAS